MNEKKFHKKIENSLTQEEKQQKEKAWEKIVRETGYSPNKKEKPHFIFKLMPIAVCLVLACIIIPLTLNLGRGGKNSLPEQAITDASTKSENSSDKPGNSKTNENVQIHESSASNSTTVTTPAYEFQTFEGEIVVQNEKFFFRSLSGEHYKEITDKVLIYDASAKTYIDRNVLYSGQSVTGEIVIKALIDDEYKVGDIRQIIIK